MSVRNRAVIFAQGKRFIFTTVRDGLVKTQIGRVRPILETISYSAGSPAFNNSSNAWRRPDALIGPTNFFVMKPC